MDIFSNPLIVLVTFFVAFLLAGVIVMLQERTRIWQGFFNHYREVFREVPEDFHREVYWSSEQRLAEFSGVTEQPFRDFLRWLNWRETRRGDFPNAERWERVFYSSEARRDLDRLAARLVEFSRRQDGLDR